LHSSASCHEIPLLTRVPCNLWFVDQPHPKDSLQQVVVQVCWLALEFSFLEESRQRGKRVLGYFLPVLFQREERKVLLFFWSNGGKGSLLLFLLQDFLLSKFLFLRFFCCKAKRRLSLASTVWGQKPWGGLR